MVMLEYLVALTSSLAFMECYAAEIRVVSSFVSNDGLYCAQGTAREAASSLATKKAAPLGVLFNESVSVLGRTCAERGYAITTGVDHCTPSVETFFKAEADLFAFGAAENEALESFRASHKLEQNVAALMLACTCVPGSPVHDSKADECSELDFTFASWVERDPWSGRELACSEGPFVYAVRSLSVLKSSPKLAMHAHDHIIPAKCDSLESFNGRMLPNECFPAMQMRTRSSLRKDPDVSQIAAIESNLTEGGFEQFADEHGIEDWSVLNNDLRCNCLPNSWIGKSVSKACSGPTAIHFTSPVRDWWMDYLTVI